MTGLREQRIFGLRTRDGRVLVPPPECDPMTGESLEEWVEVACCGEIVTWAWMDRPRRNQPLSEPFAWALIRLDGADSSLLHVVSVPSVEAMRTGMRVQASWRKERVGHMKDIACFIPEVS